MTSDFKACLDKGSLRKASIAPDLASKELDLAKADLNAAKSSLKGNDSKWDTVQAYYSMFHAGRALVYKEGYRERSHACLIIALKEIYQGKGLDVGLIDAMQEAKALRENADYVGEFSHDSAARLVEATKKFYSAAKSIFKRN